MTFTGKAEPGSIVTVRDGSRVLGTTKTATNGTFAFETVLAAGPHSLSAFVTDSAGNVSAISETFATSLNAQFALPPGTAGILKVVQANDGKALVQLVKPDATIEDLLLVSGSADNAVVQGVNSAARFGTVNLPGIAAMTILVSTYPGPINGQSLVLPLSLTISPLVGNSAQVEGSALGDAIDLGALYASAPASAELNARGGLGNDMLTGNAGTNVLDGGLGNDTLIGSGGSDKLYGGDGDDTLLGGFNASPNTQPGDGDDWLEGGAGNDSLRGGDGDDTLLGGAGNDNLRGDAGNDTIDGGDGIDVVSYRFDDILQGREINAREIAAKAVSTFAEGRGGTDTISNVEVLAIVGTQGDDAIYGSLYTAGSPDGVWANQLSGEGGNDVIIGADRNDLLSGGLGDDVLIGSGGDDALYGGGGNDYLQGGTGNDSLFGGDSNDYLQGGAGNDKLTGGNGADTFAWSSGQDEILDFEIGTDKIAFNDPSLASFGDLQKFMSQVGSNVVITYPGPDQGSSIVIYNVLLTSLSASDFIFNDPNPLGSIF